MATVRRTRRFQYPAELVWGVLGRVDILDTWWPGVDSCVMSTDDEGRTVRTLTIGVGIPAPETILEVDHLQRHLCYELALPIITYHRATLDVVELSPTECLVVYLTDCRPNPMALMIGGASGTALELLQEQLDAGSGPAITAAGLDEALAAFKASAPAAPH